MIQNALTDRESVPPLPPNGRVQFHPFRRPMKKSPAKQRSVSSNSAPATDYGWEITGNMLQTEGTHLPPPNYMKTQSEITEKTRAVLVDWLVSLHTSLKLMPETLFLSVSLLDRLLAQEEVKKVKVQLVGVTVLLVASKYEEVSVPPVQQYVDAMDGAYTKKELLDMERITLTSLGFLVTTPTSYTFFTRATSLVVEDRVTLHFAQYLLELALGEYQLLEFRPSLVMSAAFFLAKKLRGKPNPWPDQLQKQFSYTEPDLKRCAKVLFIAWQSAEKSVLQGIRKKFAVSLYSEVSKIRFSPA